MGRSSPAGCCWPCWLLLLAEVVLAWQFGHYSGRRWHHRGAASPPADCLPDCHRAWSCLVRLPCRGLAVLLHDAWTGDFLGFLPDCLRRGLEARARHPAARRRRGQPLAPGVRSYLWDAAADPWLAGACRPGRGRAGRRHLPARRQHSQRGTTSCCWSACACASSCCCWSCCLPQLTLWFERQGWPDVVILLDDSQSMSTVDHYRDPRSAGGGRPTGPAAESGADRARSACSWPRPSLHAAEPDWLDRAADRAQGAAARLPLLQPGRIAWPTSREATEARQAAESHQRACTPSGESSQLGTAVRQVLNDFRGSSLAAVVMLTDGVTTEGEDLRQGRRSTPPRWACRCSSSASATPTRSATCTCTICRSRTASTSTIASSSSRLTGPGLHRASPCPFTLCERRARTDRSLGRQDRSKTSTDPQGKPVKVRLTHQADRAGREDLRHRGAGAGRRGQTSDNNRLERTVFVREAKLIKVLYVEGYPPLRVPLHQDAAGARERPQQGQQEHRPEGAAARRRPRLSPAEDRSCPRRVSRPATS